MEQIVVKKVCLQLSGLDGNAFNLLGAFRKQAQREKWTKEEIDAVTTEAMNGDYDHLLVTLSAYCQDDEDCSSDEDDELKVCSRCYGYMNDEEDGEICEECQDEIDDFCEEEDD